MIKYRTKLIEKLTHGKSVSHLIKTLTGKSKPPEVVTCFGSYKANMDAPGDFWEKQFFTYSRNGGPIQRITIDYSTAEGEEDYIAIDALCGKVDKDLTRGQDGESLAFYINAGIRGLTAIGEQAIPVVNGTMYYGPDSPQMMSMSGPDQFEYAITGINGEGKVVLPSAYVVDARDIAVPHPFESIDPFNVIDYPRWYPENSIQTEDNTITIYPSEGASEDDFDLFKVMGGVGDTPITVHSCVVAIPPKVQCLPSFVYTAGISMPAMMSLETEVSPQSLNLLEGIPNTVNGLPFPFNMDGKSNSGYTPTNWPNSDGNMWGWDWVCTYSKNDGPIKTIGWNTGSNEGQHHSVWEAIKALMLDDEGRTAFTLTGFNAISPRWDRPSLKSGLSSGAMFGDFNADIDMDIWTNYEYREDAASVEIKDRQMQFTQTQAGLAWKENKLVIYPTTFEDAKQIGMYEYDDYYNFLCQFEEQVDEGKPITLHSCAVVEPVDHVRPNTGFSLDTSSLGNTMPPGLIARLQINDGEIKEFAEEGELVQKLVADLINYVSLLGADPIVTPYSGMNNGGELYARAQSKTNLLYFKAVASNRGSTIVGCSGIERSGDFNMDLVNIDMEAQRMELLQVEILDDMNSDIPHVRGSNKVTFHRAVGSEYVDFFDFIVGAKGDTHTIYSSAGIPCLLHGESVEGGGDNGSIDDLEDEYMQWREPWVFSITKTNGMGESFNPTISAVYGTDFVIVDHDTGERLASTFGRTHEGIIERIPENKNLNIIFNMDALGGSRTFELHFGITGGSVVFGNDIDVGGRKEGELEIIQWNSDCAPKVKISAANMTVKLPQTLPKEWTSLSFMFTYTNMANPDISMWDVSHVVDMQYMFENATGFNQDLSNWCVQRMSIEPYHFRKNATKWTLPKPVWGTCPAPKPDLPDGTPLEFNIYSPSTNNPVVPLTFTIKAPESGWKIYENNILVCSRWTDGPGIHTINGNNGFITIQVDRNNLMDKTVNYKLFAKTDRVRVSRGYSNLTGASPSIDVISFSDSCASQAFGFEWANLTVPTVLPPCITNAYAMFEECRRLNQDLSMWDTSNILYMNNMFATCSSFNADISSWDVSNVTNMESMFARATNFNQDLSGWNVVNIPTEPSNFAINATQWTLPKPVWGTSGGTIVEPVGDTFEFTVVSEDTTAGAKPLVMNLGMGEDTWQLTSDGTVIASPTSTGEGITVENLYGDRVVTISNLRARTVNYVLTLKSSMLQLGDKNYTITANNRAINITKFSDTVDLYKFNLDHTGLTVPNSIPTTLTSLGEMFAYCKVFNDPAVTYWNTENITNMAGTFDRCNAFNQPLNWSTHQVTTMKAMFRNCHVFDQDINNWNVGQVTDMESMFMGCRVFNQPLNDWNVSSVTKMTELFRDCKQFNKYIANWDVSKVDSFEFCFSSATAFNEDISIWNVKSARWMDYMFSGATSFNQNLSGWCVTGVDSKPPKFDDGALAWRKQRPIWGTCPLEKSPEPLDPTVFNAEVKLGKYDYQYKTKIVLDISDDSSDWEVYYNDDLVASPTVGGPDWTFVQKVGNNVTINPNSSSALVTVRGTMKNLKLKVEAFPQTDPAVKISHFSNTISSYSINTGYAPLSVPKTLPGVVNSMATMFNGTNNIVTDITGWDTSNVTDMQYLFSGCGAFNQDIGSWNVSAVTNMEAMFYEAWKFNGNIGQWNTGNVTNMAYMFYNSHAFNQDLSGWNVSLIPTKPDSFGDQWLPDWTLPKPIWGSDGKSPEVDFTDAFEFNVTSPLNGGFELSMSDVVGSYSIYVDNVLHSTGSETYPGKIFRDIPQGSVNYKIVANCAALKLMTTSGYTLTDLTVTSFGNNIDIARFSLGNIKLTVPTTLPSHMTNLSGMFSGSYKFNQDLSGWDVSRVTNMSSMFYQAKTFNGNISNWDMSNVTDMTLMFKSCELFNQDISGWNVSKCTKMTELFYSAEIFNQDISGWQVGSVSNMDRMFYAAKKFNQDLSGWNVGLISVEPSSFAPYTPVWVRPKPVWGTVGKSPEKYLPIDVTGESGVYITLSRDGVNYTTFDMTDPSFNQLAFQRFAVVGDDDNSFAFVGYPYIIAAEDLLPEDATHGLVLCGLTAEGKVITPRHPDGYTIVNGVILDPNNVDNATEVSSPPLKINKVNSVIYAKATQGIPKEYDMFYSLNGAVEGGIVKVISKATISFD